MSRLASRFVVAVGLLFGFQSAIAEQCEMGPDRVQVYISDTHVGMGGRCTSGDSCSDGWDNMEDFRWHEDFEAFVAHLAATLNKPLDLIVVGDFLELWQDPTGRFECGQSDARRSNFGCNAAQASARVGEIGVKHEDLFSILTDLVSENDNRIILLPGNHDAVLVMTPVAQSVKNRFPLETRDSICIDEDGMLLLSSGEHKVFVEHGHQIKGDLNRYENPENGVVECIDATEKTVDCNAQGAFVRRTWGENFVQNYYNDYEKRLPVIDNYSVEGSGVPDGVKRGYKASAPDERKEAFLGFAKFFFAKQTMDHLRGFLGGVEEPVTEFCAPETTDPCIDINQMRQWPITHPVFAQLPAGQGEWLYLVFNIPGAESASISDVYNFYVSDREIIDQMIVTTCIYWSKSEEAGSPGCEYENMPLGALSANVGNWFKAQLDENFDELATHIESREALMNSEFTHFIYGHTHRAESRRDRTKGRLILNTGAWQRVASSRVIADLIEDCVDQGEKNENECFADLTPSKLPACYSLVAAVSGLGPKLYWWARKDDDPAQAFKLYEDGKQPPNCRP